MVRPPATPNWQRLTRVSLGIAAAFAVAGGPTAASAEPARAEIVGERPISTLRHYSLDECLRLAELNYPKVRESRARLDRIVGQLWEAKTAPFSEWKLEAGVGIAPSFQGTSVFSPSSDVALSSNVALAWKVGIDGVIPLWTFGKITSLREAAEANVHVHEHDLTKSKNEVKLAVRKAYYGLQFARDALALVRKAASSLDEYLERLQREVDEGDGDDIELYKVKMYRAELEARESEAIEQAGNARAGLRFLIGARGPVDIPDKPLRQVGHDLAPLARYLSAARLFRPEVNMARAGVVAREAQLRLQTASYYPDIGAGFTMSYVRVPQITDQLNPFVQDTANTLFYGAGLVLRWKLDLLSNHARVMQAEAQLEEMRATETFALGGVAVEVEQAFNVAQQARNRLDAYKRAASYAKRWLISVRQGIDVGTFDDEDIVEPAKEWALKRFSQMDATYRYNMAMAQLALATGWDAIAQVN